MWLRGSAASSIVLVALSWSGIVHAGDKEVRAPDPAPSASAPEPWLLGDWNGARTRLKERGIDFQFGYTGEFAYNATGGIESKARYTDQYVAGRSHMSMAVRRHTVEPERRLTI